MIGDAGTGTPASQVSAIAPKSALAVTIPATGDVSVAGKPVKDAELDKVLASTADKTTPVVVTADKAISYARVVAVLDRLKKAGFTRLAIATNEVATTTSPTTDKAKLALTLAASGEVFVGDKLAKDDDLDKALAAVTDKSREVVLFVDSSLPYARVLNVLERVKKSGFSKVGLAVEPSKTQPPAKAPAPRATPAPK